MNSNLSAERKAIPSLFTQRTDLFSLTPVCLRSGIPKIATFVPRMKSRIGYWANILSHLTQLLKSYHHYTVKVNTKVLDLLSNPIRYLLLISKSEFIRAEENGINLFKESIMNTKLPLIHKKKCRKKTLFYHRLIGCWNCYISVNNPVLIIITTLKSYIPFFLSETIPNNQIPSC